MASGRCNCSDILSVEEYTLIVLLSSKAQTTSLQNIKFVMPTDPSVVHVGLFIEEGSAGLVADLTFTGGATGMSVGNQQYTMRNLVFNNCKTGKHQTLIRRWSN